MTFADAQGQGDGDFQGDRQGRPYNTMGGTRTPAPMEAKYRRFHGSVQINPRMMAGEAGKIMDEVVKHLTTLYGANVRVTLEIEATVPDGVSEENCRTLRFEGFGFEEE